MSAHDAAIYAANDLITALTKPKPQNAFVLLGDEHQKLANIFQTAITKQPISALGVPDSEPTNRPRTCSQTKMFANAALTPTQIKTLLQTPPEPTINQHKEGDPFLATFPESPIDISYHHKPRIIPIISTLRPKYPT